MERRAGLYGALSQAQIEEDHLVEEHEYQEEEQLGEQDLDDAEYLDYMQWEGETEEQIVHSSSNGHVLMRRDEPQGEEYAEEDFSEFVEFTDEEEAKRYIAKMEAGGLMEGEEELIEEAGEGPSQYIHEEELHDPGRIPHFGMYQQQTGSRRRATTHECEICGAYLKHPSKIAAHMRTHTGERPFVCEVCGRAFTQRTPWRMHMKRHEQDLPFLCSSGCGKAFPNASQRNAHDLRHIGRPRQGQPRPHLKPQKRRIVEHDRMVELREAIMDERRGPPVIEAPLFELSDDAHKRIDEVINAVAENRPVKQMTAKVDPVVAPLPPRTRARRAPPIVAECQICGLLLKHPSKIQAHMRSHTGVKPYKCTMCGMSVATFYALRMHHRRRHQEGERPIPCTWECGRRFVSASAKNEHERIVHAGIKRYVCSVGQCSRLFSRRSHLINHRLKDHPGLVHVDEYDDAVDLEYEEIREMLGDEDEEEGEEEGVETHHIEEEEGGAEVVEEAVDGHVMEDGEEARSEEHGGRPEETEGQEQEQGHQRMDRVFRQVVRPSPSLLRGGTAAAAAPPTPSPPPVPVPMTYRRVVPVSSGPPQEMSLPRPIPVVPRVTMKTPRIVRVVRARDNGKQ